MKPQRVLLVALAAAAPSAALAAYSLSGSCAIQAAATTDGPRGPDGASARVALEHSDSDRLALVHDDEAAASARGISVGFDELERVLVDRHALSEDGRAILSHRVQLTAIDHLGRERGVTASAAEVAREWNAIDAQVRSGVDPEGLESYLASSEVDPLEFRETLRIGLIHRKLARVDLGIPENEEISGEQQSIWLDEALEKLGVEGYPPPYADGVVARVGPVEISAVDFRAELREQLDPVFVREACRHLVLAKLLELRMPPFSDADQERAAVEAAVTVELDRRRAAVRSNPAYEGVPIEQLLISQGFRIDAWPNDPGVRVSALATLFVDRVEGEEGLRREYEERKDFYEGHYGEAVRARWILLSGSNAPGAKRTQSQAMSELERVAGAIPHEQEFAVRAYAISEDQTSSGNGGDLGWIRHLDDSVFPEVRDALFAAAGIGQLPAGGRLAGPVRIPEGAALFWIGELRPSPGWGEMRGYVHDALRQRLVDETLPPEALRTYLDPPPPADAESSREGDR